MKRTISGLVAWHGVDMASSMETNVSLNQWARVGKIPGVKQRDFESRRHPSSKRGKEKKKRQVASAEQGADEKSLKDKDKDNIGTEGEKKEIGASGSRLNVIV